MTTKIGVISPASWMDDVAMNLGVQKLEAAGYMVKVFGDATEQHGKMSASDEIRAEHIECAFADPSVDVILCSRGGYGSARTLRHLDFDLISRHRKPLFGYSDVTYLLEAFHRESGVPVYHGPMLTDIAKKNDKDSFECLARAINGATDGFEFGANDATVLKHGNAEGQIAGGNLAILSSMMGVGEISIPDRHIVLLEDINEYMYQIDRYIVHLKRAGYFSNMVGLIVSDGIALDVDKANSLGFTIEELIDSHFGSFEGPIIIDAPCGHQERQLTIPFYQSGLLETGRRGVKFRPNFSKELNTSASKNAA